MHEIILGCTSNANKNYIQCDLHGTTIQRHLVRNHKNDSLDAESFKNQALPINHATAKKALESSKLKPSQCFPDVPDPKSSSETLIRKEKESAT